MNVCKILLIVRHIGQSHISIDQNKMLPNLTNYLRQLSKTEEENHFFLPWGGLCLRNCDDNGDLLKFKSVKDYKRVGKRLWLHLPLLLFRENVSTIILLAKCNNLILLFGRMVSFLCSSVQNVLEWSH